MSEWVDEWMSIRVDEEVERRKEGVMGCVEI